MAVEDKRPGVIPELEVDLHLAVGPEDHGVLLGDAILFQYVGARTVPVPAQDGWNSLWMWMGCHHPPELFFKCQISGPLMAGCAIGELRATSCQLITQAPWLRSNTNSRRVAWLSSRLAIAVKCRSVMPG